MVDSGSKTVTAAVRTARPRVSGQVLEFHRSDKLCVLAVAGAHAPCRAPDLPTAAELGLPGLIATGAVGLPAPAGTSQPIIDQIAQVTRMALTERAFLQMLMESGVEPMPDSSPEKFRQMLADDVAGWTPIVKALRLKID